MAAPMIMGMGMVVRMAMRVTVVMGGVHMFVAMGAAMAVSAAFRG